MKVIIKCWCPFCTRETRIQVCEEQYTRWQQGELIQNAMPDLSATEREVVKTGICPKCQPDFFNE